jgi:hypothetical protein
MKKVIKLTETELKKIINKIISESYDMQENEDERLEDMYRGDSKGALKKALDMTKGMDPEERMDKINEVINGYGVEAIRGDSNNRYFMDTVGLYVNMGDTYALTVVYDTQKNGFYITTWGDWVERNQEKYNIV